MTKLFFIFTLLVLAATSTNAADAIPPHLVGVWATDGSVLEGPYLFEGQALYLGADGIGGVLVGPPAMGFKIVATFDTKKNIIESDIYERKQRGPHLSFAYDPNEKTIDSGTPDEPQPMRRRFDTFTDEMKKVLGLEP
jgi:hypothetical protein